MSNDAKPDVSIVTFFRFFRYKSLLFVGAFGKVEEKDEHVECDGN